MCGFGISQGNRDGGVRGEFKNCKETVSDSTIVLLTLDLFPDILRNGLQRDRVVFYYRGSCRSAVVAAVETVVMAE